MSVDVDIENKVANGVWLNGERVIEIPPSMATSALALNLADGIELLAAPVSWGKAERALRALAVRTGSSSQAEVRADHVACGAWRCAKCNAWQPLGELRPNCTSCGSQQHLSAAVPKFGRRAQAPAAPKPATLNTEGEVTASSSAEVISAEMLMELIAKASAVPCLVLVYEGETPPIWLEQWQARCAARSHRNEHADTPYFNHA